MTKAEIEKEIERLSEEFAKAEMELGKMLDAFEEGLVTEREVDYYGEDCAELQDELEERQAELAKLIMAEA